MQRIVDTLQLAFEVCADVASHALADRGVEVPSTYAGIFEALGRERLLAPDLGEVMVRIAGFRDVLVHEYAAVDARIVVKVLREHLDDFARFRDAAKDWA